jgi:CubicO group peptidase (beta-lactamase class C family)
MRWLAILSTLVVLMAYPLIVSAGELPAAKPEEVGLSAENLAALTPKLKTLVDDGKVAGGVAMVLRRGKVAYQDVFGYRDLESKTPMSADTIFAIMSMTKPVTCVAAMTLVEQGKLGLDDAVETYLPELKAMRVLGDAEDDKGDEVATVPAKRSITVRDLFSHTSGFSYGAFLSNHARLGRSYAQAKAMGQGMKSIGDQVERLGKVALAHQPGEGWTYGLSHDVLGRVIEVVSGQNFDQFLRARLFDPLDMPDTGFFVLEAKGPRLATVYQSAGKKLTPLPRNYGSQSFFSGGGGLFSTARDYARFAQMLENGGNLDGTRILKAETIRLMTQNQIGTKSALFPGVKYGLGFGLILEPGKDAGSVVPSRYFWTGAYSTFFWVEPPHEMTALLLTQVVPLNQGIEEVFRRGVDAAVVK